jgi:hypothetical protein
MQHSLFWIKQFALLLLRHHSSANLVFLAQHFQSPEMYLKVAPKIPFHLKPVFCNIIFSLFDQ